MLSFHLPRPRGKGDGIGHERSTANWSERGHGRMVQSQTWWSHDIGHPIRSILDAREPSGFIHFKPGARGCTWFQVSTIQQSSKSVRSKRNPLRSKDLSKTALRSPATTVGIAGSTLSMMKRKKSSLSGLRLGANRHAKWKETPLNKNSAKTKRPRFFRDSEGGEGAAECKTSGTS